MSNYKVGSHTEEGVASGTSSVGTVSKRNIGILGSFIRGVPGTPIKVNSLEDFNRIFGGQSASFYGPAFVKSIFDEADDAEVILYLLRINDAGTVASGTIQIPTLTGSGITATIKAAYEGTDDPGSWGNNITVKFYSKGARASNAFRLEVNYGDTQESYDYATLAEIQQAVNDYSSLISITFTEGTPKPVTLTEITGTVAYTSGTNTITGTSTKFKTDLSVGSTLYLADGTVLGTVMSISSDTALSLTKNVSSTEASAKLSTGEEYVISGFLSAGTDATRDMTADDFNKFNGVDVQIITFTEGHTLENAILLNNYIANRADPLGVVCMPLDSNTFTGKLWHDTLVTSKQSFIAVYNCWATVYDENYNKILIPGTAPILGSAYLRNAYVQGDGIHIPPGGTDGAFKNVLTISPANLEQSEVDDFVQKYFINVVRYDRNYGFYVASSRTMSSNKLYMSIHIRLQTSYYKRYLESILLPYTQKGNTPELKNAMLVDCRSFFKSEYDAGALERSISFEEAYQGICDLSNNPRKQDRKLINIDCLFVPTECTEAIRLKLLRNDAILTVTEG